MARDVLSILPTIESSPNWRAARAYLGAIRFFFMPAAPLAVQRFCAGALGCGKAYGSSTAAAANVQCTCAADAIEDRCTATQVARRKAGAVRCVWPVSVIGKAAGARLATQPGNGPIERAAPNPANQIK